MNERLRTVMLERGVAFLDLAVACEVDPKTVERWVTRSRVPHRRHRWAAARFLEADETHLWPQLIDRESPDPQPADAELIRFYPNRAAVQRDVWLSMIDAANANLDILVMSGTFFSQTPHLSRLLARRAEGGTCIRLCFGDPSSDAVTARDNEENLRGTLASKIRAALTYFEDLAGQPKCEVRLHSTTLYASVFRFDDDMLINTHAWGQPASSNPVIHIRRLDGAVPGAFDHYLESFDAVWATASAWIPAPEK